MDNLQYVTPYEPEKKFMLVMKDRNGDQHVTWHESIDDLKRCVSEHPRYTIDDALEICSCRDIDLSVL